MGKGHEQMDIFPEEAGRIERAKEKRKKWPVNPGEIRRKRKKAEKDEYARYSIETAKRLIDEAIKKHGAK
ncbi:MAG: hypothetical protein HYW88_02685 [Candidatus Sungbacteria bacterium]|nr:hypothetical protein [Candidatus Sungbacteria bacterium]